MFKKITPGTDGEKYLPFAKRSGPASIVYFTRDLSENGLKKIYERVNKDLKGKVAIKVHTGEAEGPNIIPVSWIKELVAQHLPDATIIETNTYYQGSRYTTEEHRKTLAINGWTFCPVDIIDAEGTVMLPVNGGKWLKEISVGKNLLNYDSMLVLTHFKGHTSGGFGGSNKNIGIGCADGRIGKGQIHSHNETDGRWKVVKEELMERISESTKGTIDHFGNQVAYINVMRNMSVDCDCTGKEASPVEVPDIGILASCDILAVDNACVDLIFNLPQGAGKELIERITSRHGLRQLSYMKELGMGNDRYVLIDIDHNDAEVTSEELVKDLRPGWIPDRYNVFPGKNRIK